MISDVKILPYKCLILIWIFSLILRSHTYNVNKLVTDQKTSNYKEVKTCSSTGYILFTPLCFIINLDPEDTAHMQWLLFLQTWDFLDFFNNFDVYDSIWHAIRVNTFYTNIYPPTSVNLSAYHTCVTVGFIEWCINHPVRQK